MTLLEKMNNIANPKLPSFNNAESRTVEDFWRDFIEPRLPKNIDNVIEWHKLLSEYVKLEGTVLAFRTGNTAGALRRGWETITNDGYSFFYTDNYFSHYFFKLAYDADYEPNLSEFYKSMKEKSFPVRILRPMGTKDEPYEKEYAAFDVSGKNPGIGTSGYKLAHLIDAGKNYYFNNKILGLSEICKTYFSLGVVSDWKIDLETGKYCRKDFVIPDSMKEDARKIAEACFLRMVHPMNYFLSPKSRNQGNTYNSYTLNGEEKYNIAEEPVVISYVKTKFHERYQKNGIDYFQEFLDLVYPTEDFINENGSTIINLRYSQYDLVSKNNSVLNQINQPSGKKLSPKVMNEKTQDVNNVKYDMAWEYLTNPNTSFRKLEIEIMGISSPARGGGFKSKSIINALGITANKKGILSLVPINTEIENSSGTYKLTLQFLKENYLSVNR